MGYKRSKHYNATYKLVKEKRIILQTDVQSVMNGSITKAVEQLENEGKIKRKKVGVRHKNGNLNYQWLLYLTGTDHNDILDYEKELINRPFKSPLEEHHCYKSDDNIIDMQEYIKVNDNDLMIKEYNGERIVTFNDVDNVHQRPKGTARANFNRNKNRFSLNEDYFELTGEELSRVRLTYAVHKSTTKLIVLTESGYLMLVKTFTDDLSWEVQRQLVNTYFKMKELSVQNEVAPIPTGQIQPLDIMEMMVKEMKKQNERVDALENKLNTIVKVLSQ